MFVGLQEINDALQRRPFQPFRAFISDGETYDIRHPELCVPGRHSVFIGVPAPGSEEMAFDRYAIVDLFHITRLEPLMPPSPAAGGVMEVPER